MTHVTLRSTLHPHRRTKIIATLGPSTRSPAVIEQLILAGANVFRFNFSHGTHEEHRDMLAIVRSVADSLHTYVAVLQDLSGPKIRITPIEGDRATIVDGGLVTIRRGSSEMRSSAEVLYVETLHPASFVKPGDKVLLGDGAMTLEVRSVIGEDVQCSILKGGRIRSRMGIAFPDSTIDIPATTTKDMDDLAWGVRNGVDYIAVSFVNNAKDVLTVRNEIRRLEGDARVVAKIERRSAVENIDEILDVADGIMVARGDLGVELPLEKLPLVQKNLIERSNNRELPVIVATQMLQSMVTSLRPTRAEVSDVSTAVMNGADAVMLSEETAIGEHPAECVRYLDTIAHEVEQSFQFEEYKLRLRAADSETIPDAIAYAACGAAVKLQAAAIIACTETGYSARLVAKYRPQQALYGTSSSAVTLRRMCLYWGVHPTSCQSSDTHADEILAALRAVQQREGLKNGSRAVITGGLSVRTPGATSVLEVREMSFLKE